MILDDRCRRIFIMTTYACNLNCVYCYEVNKHKSPDVDIEKIKIALTKEFEAKNSIIDSYEITFHGGEPFLSFDKIITISEWVWANFAELRVGVDISTNGTILTQEIKEWLTKNSSKVRVSVSIDGCKETHNLNRGNSFDKIDVDFFTSLYTRTNAKMTVCPNTLESLFDNFIYLKSLGFNPTPSLAIGADWSDELHLKKYIAELGKLVDYYANTPREIPIKMLSVNLLKYSPIVKIERMQNCGACHTVVAYDIEGNKYPCHSFITNFFVEYDVDRVTRASNSICNIKYTELFKDCKDCFFQASCSPCFGANYNERGDIDMIDKRSCSFYKASVLATAQLFAKAIADKDKYVWLKHRDEREIVQIIAAIKHIYTNMN